MLKYCITILQKEALMTATVRLDNHLEKTLNTLSASLHKKKSDIIRDAISFYAHSIERDKKKRILHAIHKTKEADKSVYNEMEGTLDDGI